MELDILERKQEVTSILFCLKKWGNTTMCIQSPWKGWGEGDKNSHYKG